MAKALQWTGFIAGLGALILQFALTIPASMEAGRSFAGSIVYFFSFFTILTNILAMLTHATGLGLVEVGLSPLLHPRIRAGIAVAITIVGLIYFLVLARLWQPQGWWFVADAALHYVTPTVFVAWWLLSGADGSTRWSDPLLWLAWPVAYVVYALARAPVAGEVPYPFLDYMQNGWGSVAMSIGGIVIMFVVIGLLAVAADHGIGRRREATSRA